LIRGAARAAGDVGDLWICADDEDRAKQLYTRLGFRPALATIEFLLLPDPARPAREARPGSSRPRASTRLGVASRRMTGERFEVGLDRMTLVGERWRGTGPPVVLLHAGVCDRRSWLEVAQRLHPDADLLAYDRRGHGETPASSGPFTHLDDLLAVLDHLDWPAAWLVGSSMGGGLALDAALTAPDRVAGLVLVSPGIVGSPDPPDTEPDYVVRLDTAIEAAVEAGALDEVNRLETWLWLDGPAGPEGRVEGAVRDLALAMNQVILANSPAVHDGASGIDAWSRLAEVRVPTTVIWGDLDIPSIVDEARVVSERLPDARPLIITGTAHLPYLEQPDRFASAVLTALTAGGR
jgi:pimeloyl-ACP methyl ester carboxylesterase